MGSIYLSKISREQPYFSEEFLNYFIFLFQLKVHEKVGTVIRYIDCDKDKVTIRSEEEYQEAFEVSSSICLGRI